MEMLSLMGILGFFSIEDIKERRIGIIPLLLAAIFGLILHLCYERLSIWNLLGGGAIGLLMYALSIASKERIGKGDALLLAVTGIFLGFWDNLILIWLASIVAAVVGILYMLFLKKGKNEELPFVPCVFFGFVIYRILQNVGGAA